ncbi:Ig-like domain-containing protein [Hymenobacter guriensis]|uniref:Cadherin domain-containing protein n=1 Tax=Hymenobacter guriensis TaxID=2793065 RepID=A0ABS0L4V3_9BACT|nr:Ig-like domain-containing protein [Hymenobacter guriensis]MBG8554970.1 cadherin domain-containing protein [Hymenobacter guriensis]
MKRILLLWLALLLGLSPSLWAQSVIRSQSFETDDEDNYTSNTFDFRGTGVSLGNNQYFTITTINPAHNPDASNYSLGNASDPVTIRNNDASATPYTGNFWIAEGVRGTNQTGTAYARDPGHVTLNAFNASGYTDIKVIVALADPRGPGSVGASGAAATPTAGSFQADDKIEIQYSTDNGANFTTIGRFKGNNNNGSSGYMELDYNRNDDVNDEDRATLNYKLTDYTFGPGGNGSNIGIPGSPSSLIVRVVLDQRGTSHEIAFDNIRVVGTPTTVQPPTLADAQTGTVNYTEGSAATQITNSIVATNPEGANLTGATVSIISGLRATEDQLLFTNQNGITGSFDSGTGVLTLSGTTSVANYQAALRTVTYKNSNLTTARSGNRAIQFVVKNGASTSTGLNRTVLVKAILGGPATLPYTEDFTTDGEGVRYGSNAFVGSGGNGTAFAFTRTSNTPYETGAVTFSNISNSFFWYGVNIKSGQNPSGVGRLETQQLDATSYSNLHFQIRLGAESGSTASWQNTDSFMLYYRTGGSSGTWKLFGSFRGTTASINGTGDLRQDRTEDLASLPTLPAGTATLSPSLTNFDFSIPADANGQLVDFKLELINDDSRAEFAFDLIQVTGTANTAPTISSQTRSIAENAANGTNVGAVIAASDADAGQTLTYAITAGNTAGAFAINSATGQLTVAHSAALDFEATPTYSLTVQVTDNAAPAASASATVTVNVTDVDDTAPSVSITSSGNTNGGGTGTSPIPFTVTFSESVTGFVQGDLTVSGGTVSNFSGSGTTYTFSLIPSGNGTKTVNVPATVAQDAAGNLNTAATQYSLTYTAPTTTVASVTRLTPSPTATAQVRYRVVFAASVTGVSTDNFSLSNHGSISGASVSSVSGSGMTYTVTVNTGSGNGAIRLDVNNGTGVMPTITNVPYTSGEVYDITKSFAAQPQLAIVGTGGTGSDVTAFVDVVQVLSGGTAFANGLQNGSFETHNPLANGNYGYTPTGASWTFNALAGIAEEGSAFTPTTPIPNGSAVAFVQSNGGSNGQLQQKLALPTGGNYQVSFQAAQRICCTTLDQALNVFLNGVYLGTIQPNSNAYSTFTSAAFSVTAPALTASISSTAPNPTSTAPIPVTVTFSQSVTDFTASDVAVTNGSMANFAGSGTTYTFVVAPNGDGAVTVNVPANSAFDANNTGNAAASQFSITYEQAQTAAPVITSPANGSITNQSVSISGTAPAGSSVRVYVSQNGGAFQTFTLAATAGGTFSSAALPPATYQAYATAQSPGEAVSGQTATITFTVDQTAPTVTLSSSTAASGSSTSTSPFAFTATFSESVTGFVAGDLLVTNGTVSSFAGSGTTYTFNVTPTTPGTATTVTVFGNSSQDAASNGNAASNTYALTLAPTSVTWTGSISTDWYTAGNWTPAVVPTTTLNATIPGTAQRMPLIASTVASVRHLTLNSGATLSMSGGTVDVRGNLTNNGSFAPAGGTVVLGSSTLANVLGSSRVRFWNLTVNSNTAQVSTSAGASVRRLLTLTGNLSTNGNDFVLESDATSTAMVVNSGGSVVGTATVQRYIDPSLNPGLGYRHYSSPVQSTTVADLGTSGFTPVVNPAYNTLGSKATPFPTVYGYDESRIVGTSATTRSQNYGYFSPASLNTPLERGRGYTVNLAASEKVDLVGTLNTGTVAVGALSRGNQANSGWHLLGNPYPAPLDWTKVRTDLPAGVRDAVYVFKSSDQYNGTYQFYANGFGTLPGGLIPSMQGFFVRVTQTVPAFSFLSTWRTTTYSNPTFQRAAADTRPAVQLELVSAKGIQEPTFVYFEAGATAEVDNHYDAEKLLNTTGLNLSSVAAGTNLAINGLPLTQQATIVPLTVQVPTAGAYSLRAAELHNLADQTVYLHDAVTGQQINLQQLSAYSFSTSGAAQLTGRFSLHFGALVPTGSAAAALAAQVSLYPNPASTTVTLLAPRQLVGKTTTVQVLNSLGQVVRRQAVATTATGLRTELSVQGLAQGVYTVRLETNGVVVNKRLVVH